MKEYWGSGYSGAGGGGGGGGGGTKVPVVTIPSISAGELLVYVPGTNSVRKATPSLALTPSRYDIAGVAFANAAAGSTTMMYISVGELYPILFDVVPSASDNGTRVWLSTTAGSATLTPPSNGWSQSFVGILQGADGSTQTPKVLFQPRLVALLR